MDEDNQEKNPIRRITFVKLQSEWVFSTGMLLHWGIMISFTDS